jgi:hypothetical protein
LDFKQIKIEVSFFDNIFIKYNAVLERGNLYIVLWELTKQLMPLKINYVEQPKRKQPVSQ